jgi:hypothetical protein
MCSVLQILKHVILVLEFIFQILNFLTWFENGVQVHVPTPQG